jgi:peptidoglycan/LPS O-acetylase OafA/YrhL
MRISIFFPFIVWLLIKHEKKCLMIPLLGTFIYWFAIHLQFKGIIDYQHDYFHTIYLTGFFVIGAFLAKYYKSIQTAILQTKPYLKLTLLGLAILAYTNSYWLPYCFESISPLLMKVCSKFPFQDWVAAFGASLLIILSISSVSISSILDARPLKFLGKISYSLYLLHAVVIKVFITTLSGHLPLSLILILSIIGSIGVASACCLWIEVPSIRLGKKITEEGIRHVTSRIFSRRAASNS